MALMGGVVLFVALACRLKPRSESEANAARRSQLSESHRSGRVELARTRKSDGGMYVKVATSQRSAERPPEEEGGLLSTEDDDVSAEDNEEEGKGQMTEEDVASLGATTATIATAADPAIAGLERKEKGAPASPSAPHPI